MEGDGLNRGLRFVEIFGHEVALDARGQFYAQYLLLLVPSHGGRELVVPKRYSEFVVLDRKVRALPASQRPQKKDLPKLTSKKWGAGVSDDVVEKRKRKLPEYLYELATLATGYPAVHAVLQDFYAAAPGTWVGGAGEGGHHSDDEGGGGEEGGDVMSAAGGSQDHGMEPPHPHPATSAAPLPPSRPAAPSTIPAPAAAVMVPPPQAVPHPPTITGGSGGGMESHPTSRRLVSHLPPGWKPPPPPPATPSPISGSPPTLATSAPALSPSTTPVKPAASLSTTPTPPALPIATTPATATLPAPAATPALRSSASATSVTRGAPAVDPALTCAACGNTVVSGVRKAMAAGAGLTWDVSRFCSTQCEKFYNTAMSKGLVIATGADGTKRLQSAASTTSIFTTPSSGSTPIVRAKSGLLGFSTPNLGRGSSSSMSRGSGIGDTLLPAPVHPTSTSASWLSSALHSMIGGDRDRHDHGAGVAGGSRASMSESRDGMGIGVGMGGSIAMGGMRADSRASDGRRGSDSSMPRGSTRASMSEAGRARVGTTGSVPEGAFVASGLEAAPDPPRNPAAGGVDETAAAPGMGGSPLLANYRVSRRDNNSLLSQFRGAARLKKSSLQGDSLGMAEEMTISGPIAMTTTHVNAAAGAGAGPARAGPRSSSPPTPTPTTSSGGWSVFGGAKSTPAPVAAPRSAVGASAQQVHHRGYMWKRGGFHNGSVVKSWKKRWFELKDRSLFYYRTSMPVLLGVLQLFKEPPQDELIKRAAMLVEGGLDTANASFLEALLTGDGYYLAKVSELSPSAADQLGLPSSLTRRDKASTTSTRAVGVTHAGPYIFLITTPERNLFLGCETPDAYVEWTTSVRALLRNEQQRMLAIINAALPKPSRTLPPATSTVASTGKPAPTTPHTHQPAAMASATEGGAGLQPTGGRGVTMATSVHGSGPSATAPVPAHLDGTGMSAGTVGLAAGPRGATPTSMGGAGGDGEAPPSPADTGGTPHHPAAVIASSSVAASVAMIASTARPASVTTTTQVGGITTSSLTGSRTDAMGASVGGFRAAPAGAKWEGQTWEISERDIEVVDRIGAGSFGEVYRGLLWGTDVAVKLLLAAEVTPDTIDSLKAEVSILSQLRHPNVVLYLGACTTPPNIFIVTEWCERGSLHDILYDHSVPLSVATRLGLALQTAQGMAYLHSPRRQIIHRDLKSHNLLVTRDFTVKVADFGLTIMRTAHGLKTPARRHDDSSAAALISAAGAARASRISMSESALHAAAVMAASGGGGGGVSGSGGGGGGSGASVEETKARLEEALRLAKMQGPEAMLAVLARHDLGHHGGGGLEEGQFYGVQGTPQWMAPEVMEGQRYNGSVDVYSFGVVLCELASRILPFSDRYKRFDFIDAVLEEGAMPTVPRWCDQLPNEPPPWLAETEDATAFGLDNMPWGWKEDGHHMLRLPPIAITMTNPPPLLGAVFTAPASPATTDGEVHPMRPRLGSDGEGSGEGEGGSRPSMSAHASPTHHAPTSSSTAPPISDAGIDLSASSLGGVGEWCIEKGDCSGVIKLLIETCLSRNPDDRPTFEQLVELLRALIDRPPGEVFLQLDVPRLREALAYGDEVDAAVAGNEIIHFCSYALFCNMPSLPMGGSRPILRMVGTTPQPTPASRGGDGAAGPTAAVAPASRGLVMKFQPFSTVFSPLLPFAPPPSISMSHMNSVPYIDFETVMRGAPQLLAGVAARLRCLDFAIRQRLGLPIYSPDLVAAMTAASLDRGRSRGVEEGEGHGGGGGCKLVVQREMEFGSNCRVAVHVAAYRFTSPVPVRHAAPTVGATGGDAGGGGGAGGRGGSGSTSTKKSTTAGRMAARAQAAREEEEKRRRRAAVSCSAHLVHAAAVLVQVLDAGAPTPTVAAEDDGNEVAAGYGRRAKLPPTGSLDRLLLSQASRLVYSLATMVTGGGFTSLEHAFIVRPPPTTTHHFDWRTQFMVTSTFPPMPEFGPDAVAAAASLMRWLWSRLPLIRLPMAHILAVAALSVAQTLGTVTMRATTPALGGSTSQVELFVPDPIVHARYFGVLLERLRCEVGQDEGVAVPGADQHPLLLAVQRRLTTARVQLADGTHLCNTEVEPFDARLV